MTILPKQTLRKISSYRPSVAEDKSKEAIRLSVNEGALGASPSVFRIIKKWALDPFSLHRYPDQIDEPLIQSIASRYHLDPEKIVLGNGSDEIIQLLSTIYIDKGDDGVYTEYGFLVFPQSIKIAGGQPILARDKNFTVDTDNIIKCISKKTKIVFLANPNNPTGTMIPKIDLINLIKSLPTNIILVIDSAYAEYVQDQDYTDGSEFVEEFNNVVMLRTFSKIHGLASLRLGWAYCPKSIANTIKSLRAPFSVNSLAVLAGKAAIEDFEFQRKSIDHNLFWKEWTFKELTKLNIDVLPSVANFFLINLQIEENANNCIKFLSERKIYVRGMAPYKLGSFIRVSIGNEYEMKKFVSDFIEFYVKNM